MKHPKMTNFSPHRWAGNPTYDRWFNSESPQLSHAWREVGTDKRNVRTSSRVRVNRPCGALSVGFHVVRESIRCMQR
jgi:hypothetical protein